MSFWTYILRCSDDTYYTGHTDDLDRRFAQHQSGAVAGYTHDRRPVELMWAEYFPERIDALERERQVKDWSRLKKEALFRSDWRAVSDATSSRSRVSTTLDARSNRTDETKPAIILVRPQLGENIGKAARAMLNFGLTEMRLVAPRDGWPDPAAGPAASGADIVLQRAKVYDSVAEATADCTHVFATTVRRRGLVLPVVDPGEAARAIHAERGRSAILFGPERAGLETDDVVVARTIITVPINPQFGSLNLAQAVILVAYEWSKHLAAGGGSPLAQPTAIERDAPAPQADLDGLVDQLDRMLDAAGYYFPPDKVPTVKRSIRTILTRPAWTAPEVRTLRGILSTLDRPRNRRG